MAVNIQDEVFWKNLIILSFIFNCLVCFYNILNHK